MMNFSLSLSLFSLSSFIQVLKYRFPFSQDSSIVWMLVEGTGHCCAPGNPLGSASIPDKASELCFSSRCSLRF